MTEMQIQFPILKGFPCGSAVKNLPVTQESKESQIRSLDREDPLEKGMETHASIPT